MRSRSEVRTRLRAGGRQIESPSPTSNGIAVGGRSGQSSASRSDLRGFGFHDGIRIDPPDRTFGSGTGGSNPVPSSGGSDELPTKRRGRRPPRQRIVRLGLEELP